jgi:coenzyme F420-0:L-glutamate ligase/coenzyme F420-1:gamma-L-glutamate ligase
MMVAEPGDIIEILAVKGIPDVKPGDDVAKLIFDACQKNNIKIDEGDIFVIASKIVAKAEGRLVKLSDITPSIFSIRASKIVKKDPREIEAILSASRRIIRMRRGILLAETEFGVVAANAGIDKSNVGKEDFVLLLPKDPDRSARKIKKKLEKLFNKRLAVIISDTYGRTWREGQVDMAIGASGINVFRDYRGDKDMYNRTLKVTNIAQADEIASAAELVMGKKKGVPVAIVKHYVYDNKDVPAKKLNRKDSKDLYR